MAVPVNPDRWLHASRSRCQRNGDQEEGRSGGCHCGSVQPWIMVRAPDEHRNIPHFDSGKSIFETRSYLHISLTIVVFWFSSK